MNRLVIVGNGFDLAHDLNTSYKNFIYSVIMDDIYGHFDRGEQGKFIFINEKAHRSAFDFYSNIISNGDKADVSNFNSKIDLKQFNHDGFKPFYTKSTLLIKLIESIYNKGWLDLEIEYLNILKSIITPNAHNTTDIDELNSDFELIRGLMIQFLMRETKKPEPMSSIQNILMQDPSIISHDAQSKVSLKNSVSVMKVLNFNYTDTFNSYLGCLNNLNYEVYNVHGSLTDPKSVILGWGDESDPMLPTIERLNDDRFMTYNKHLSYYETNINRMLLSFLDMNKFEVQILGHSCGQSDFSMLKLIFTHKNCVQILPHYHIFEDSEGNKLDDYRTRISNISKCFGADKDKMRLTVVDKSHCFNF